MARPVGSPNKDKPFREALNIEAKLAENGEDTPAKPGSLRYIARSLLIRAGEDTASAREVGDRLDGKPAQALEHSGDMTIRHEDALEQLDGEDDGAGASDTSSAEG